MAEGGEGPDRLFGRAGSEHLNQRLCQPCLEKDNFICATGLCVDCLDYLCLKCSDDHQEQQHEVLDKERILLRQTQTKPDDSCSDSCLVHENEVIQYYCVSHCHLGCKSCIRLDHATCDEVHYIPHVSKELIKNEDYRQVDIHLKSALNTFMNVFQNAQRNSDEIDKSCTGALRELQDFKRQMYETLDNIVRKLVENALVLRLKVKQELAQMRNKYKTTHKELQSSLAKIETLQRANQNCSSYIEMMRTKATIRYLEDQTQQAEVDTSYRQSPIQFTPNIELLDLLSHPRGFGTVSSAGTRNVLFGSDEVHVVHVSDTRSSLFDNISVLSQETVPNIAGSFSVITDTGSRISQPTLRTVLSHETVPNFSDDFSVITDTGSRISHPSVRTALSQETVPNFSDDFSVITDTGSRISQPTLRTALSQETVPNFSDDFSVITDTGSRISHPSVRTALSQETVPNFSDDFSVITDTGSRISQPTLRTALSYETVPNFSDDFSVITDDTGSRISHPSVRTALSHETVPNFSDDFSVITDDTESRISQPTLRKVLSHETVPNFSDDFSVITDTGSRISQPSVRTALSQETVPNITGDFSVITDTGSRISQPTLRTALSHETVPNLSDDFSDITDTGSRISHPPVRIEYTQSWLSDVTNLHGSDAGSVLSRSAFRADHVQDIHVKTEQDYSGVTCMITGMVLLPGSRLVLADSNNSSVKAVDVQTGEVVAHVKLIFQPWDVTSIRKNKLAVTIPDKHGLAFVTVGDYKMSIDRELDVGGRCWGVSYRNGTLAVSYRDPDKVEILNLQGCVLHSITTDTAEEALFNSPFYLTVGQDDTTLFVSNYIDNNVVCVKVDGTVVATYRDRYLRGPRKAAMDSSGNVYVCSIGTNTVHQITKDCDKIQVLLTRADGLDVPSSICLSEEENKLYVGMHSDYVKVFSTGCNESWV